MGTSITVHQHGLAVSRDVDSFCNGVVFSKANIFSYKYIYFSKIYSICMLQSRLVVGAMYSVEVRCGGDWSGALRLGVTTVPAHSRPRPPPRLDRVFPSF